MREGLEIHWSIFHERVVRPILEDIEPASLGELCKQHGAVGEKQASNMVVTVKRRFQAAMRDHIRRTVLAEDQITDELAELMKFFGIEKM